MAEQIHREKKTIFISIEAPLPMLGKLLHTLLLTETEHEKGLGGYFRIGKVPEDCFNQSLFKNCQVT